MITITTIIQHYIRGSSQRNKPKKCVKLEKDKSHHYLQMICLYLRESNRN